MTLSTDQMSDVVPATHSQDIDERYRLLRVTRPELFANPEGGIVILDEDREPDSVAQASVRGGTPEVAARSGGVVYADQYLSVLRDPVRFPDDRLGMYLRVVHAGPAGAAVLPLTSDGEVVLVEHFRHSTRRWHWEIPRGFGEYDRADGALDAATATINTALREVGEELGVQARELLPLGVLHPDTGILAGPVHLFAAVIDRVGVLETAEGIRRAAVLPFAQAEDRVRNQEITDAFTISALYRARLRGLAG